MKNTCIVIPCHVPWEWTTDYVNQTAYELAKYNTVICYYRFSSSSQNHPFFRRYRKNIYFYESVQFLPGRFVALNERINTLVMLVGIFILNQRTRFRRRLIWIFDPHVYHWATRFGKSFQMVYDCVDYWSGNPHMTDKERSVVQQEEQKLLKGASLVAVNSHVLYNKHKYHRKDLILVPQGFRLDVFRRVKTYKKHIPGGKPAIGYVGAISDRLDIRLLRSLALSMPHCQFVFAGPVLDVKPAHKAQFVSSLSKRLFALPNVTYLGDIGKNRISDVIGQFDVGMIPYRVDNTFNMYCFPMKLFEYFYAGKPVVSSPITELKRFPSFVKIGNSHGEWREIILSYLSRPWPERKRKEQRSLAKQNSWERKISAISGQIA